MIPYFFLFGAIIMVMRLPSSTGMFSGRPNSSRRAPRSRLPFSSAGVPSCSPSRERSSSSVLR